MTATNENDPDLAFAELLIRWQQNLASGCPANPGDSGEASAHVGSRASGVVSCLKLLELARQTGWQPSADRDVRANNAGNLPTDHSVDADFGTNRTSNNAPGIATIGPDRPQADRLHDGTPPRIDRFEVVRELGRGGFAVVMLAWDSEMQRHVALKLPRPEVLLSEDLRDRFLRDGHAAAGLSHPGIVTIYEVGQWQSIDWIASEYCCRGTLDQLLHERKQLSDEIVVDLGIRMAEAVAHAHGRGVLHRDLKPSNILLADVDATSGSLLGDMIPKLSDFGLAKREHDPSRTRSGLLVGTPAYMAPEQARSESVDVRVDVYGLGAVLYEALAGQPPFIAATQTETLRQVLRDEPPPLRKLRPDMSYELEAIVLRCLAKEPARRYPSASALRDDFQRLREGRPTLARPSGPMGRLNRWVRNHRRLVRIAAMVASCLALLLIGASWHFGELRHRVAANERLREATDEQVKTLRRQRYVADMHIARRLLSEGKQSQCMDLLQRYRPSDAESDVRDFVWDYVWNALHAESHLLRNHATTATSAEYSPDGRWLATASHDETICLYDRNDPVASARTLRGHHGNVNDLAWFPDGAGLLSVSDDGTLRHWNPETGKTHRTIQANQHDVLCVAMSSDGSQVATGAVDGQISIWNSSSWELAHSWQAHGDWVRDLVFHSGDGQLASASNDGKVSLWSVSSYSRLRQISVTNQSVLCLAIDPSGQHLLAGTNRGRLCLIDMEGGETVRSIGGNLHTAIRRVAFLHDGQRALHIDDRGTISAWNTQTWRHLFAIHGHVGEVWGLGVSPLEEQWATCGEGGEVKIWSRNKLGTCDVFARQDGGADALAYTSDGHMLFVADGNTIRAWSIPEHRIIQEIEMPGRVFRIAISLDQHRLAAIDWDKNLQIWDLPEFRLLNQQTTGQILRDIALHPTLPILATVGSEKGARLISWMSDDTTTLLESADAPDLKSPAFSPNGRYAAVLADKPNTLSVWDWRSKRLLHEFKGVGGDVSTFTPDSQRVIAATDDNSIRVWDISNGQQVMQLAGHEGHIRCLAVGPDGNLLASLDESGSVRLWDLRSADERLNVRLADFDCRSLAFHPHGDRVAVGGKYKTGSKEGRVLLLNGERSARLSNPN